MSSQQINQEYKSLREKVSQLTNKTVTTLANLGYHEYLTIEILTNEPLEVLEQTLQSLFSIIPHADDLKKFEGPNKATHHNAQQMNDESVP